MATEDVVEAQEPEVAVHPSEQGPFDAGKQVGLGEQPFGDKKEVTGMAATDLDAAKAGGVYALNASIAALKAERDKLSTNPSVLTSGVRSVLGFVINHLERELKNVGR